MTLIKQYKTLIILIFGIILVLIPYLLFLQTPQYEEFKMWSQQNVILLCFILIAIKITGIIFPPIPGGLIILGMVPIIGWFGAYLLDLTGTLIGSSVAFFLGKKYGNKLLIKLFDKIMVERIYDIKIKKNREIESVFVLRFLFGSTLTEIICYAAGILKISYKNFVIGSIASHFFISLPAYYFANNLILGKNLWINGIIVLIAFPILWKVRGRYLE